MLVDLECQYCGYRWVYLAKNQADIESKICPMCADDSLIVRDYSKSKIDTYKDCPPFPEQESDYDLKKTWDDAWDRIFKSRKNYHEE